MRATKYTLTINTEVLSIDSFRALLYEVVDGISREELEGYSRKDDGDELSWSIEQEAVNL